MTVFSPGELLALGVAYLFLLFMAAYISESGRVPVRLLRHPLVYVLSLGVYVSAWGIYAVVGYAYTQGYNFLAFYLGISGAFLLAPVLLTPILRLSKTYQLGSLADLFAYRYRSQAAGSLTTVAMVVGVQPFLAIQIRAVADSAQILTHGAHNKLLALVFCVTIAAFTVLFGARQISPREKHEGLVVAIALESVIKLIAMLAVAAFAWIMVFNGHLSDWLQVHPEALQRLYGPLRNGFWHSQILAFLFSAVVMPFMYQMTFTENVNPKALLTASWGLPLYLIGMALAVPVLLWAAMHLNLKIAPEYFTLGVALASGTRWLPLLVFVGGLAAASGVIIVTTLALASMVLNHLVLPNYQPSPQQNIYHWVLWVRRLLIAALIANAYLFYVLMDRNRTMTEMAMLTFVATLQFAPGIIGLLFWPRANQAGFVSGLAVGMLLWFVMLAMPFLLEWRSLTLPGIDLSVASNPNYWQMVGLGAVVINTIVNVMVSLATKQSPSEEIAAHTCAMDTLRRPYRWELAVSSVQDLVKRLSEPLGRVTAEREVRLALNDLKMDDTETRPFSLRRLRDQIESNLSGLLGPTVAQDILDQHLPYKVREEQRRGEDIHYIETRLEEYRDRLSGLAAELDALRRFHRQTLYDLPTGVCSLGRDMEVLSWNRAMMELTGISDEQAVGARLNSLPNPWRTLFTDFIRGPTAHIYRKQIESQGLPRWVSLNRALISDSDHHGHGDSQVIVVEDVTELHMLESRLTHSERLASIGRLAAGVAHEIGNPVTGIAGLAQNLKAESEDAYIREASQQILEQTQRVTRIVQSLVGFARADSHLSNEREAVVVRDLVDEAIHLLQLSPTGRDYEFVNDCPPEVIVAGDSQRLTQVFINLLSNARDASPKGAQVLVRAQLHGPSVSIEVEDFGSGLPPGDIRNNLFEPFVTTKETGKGTGLGLALVHGIIDEHYGRIQLVDKADYDQGQGVIVQVTLPAGSTETL
jgi:PAS domain S-box-containing protein